MRILLKWFLRFSFLAIWLIVSVFLGGFALSIKESLGINIFSSTGYHSFQRCLVSESHKALQEKDVAISSENQKANN